MAVTTSDLGIALNDDSLNVERAQWAIDRAVTLCTSIIDPLPDAADVVVERVAGRAYVSTTAARQVQLDMADAEYGAAPGPVGGVYLTDTDLADLRRLSGGGGAFSVDLLPAGYQPPVSAFSDPYGGWDIVP